MASSTLSTDANSAVKIVPAAPPPSASQSSSSTPNENESLLPSSRPSKRRYSSLLWQAKSPRSIIILLYVIIFILAFGAKIITVPATRVQENIVCHYYYNDLEGDKHIGYDEDIPEELCKRAEIQERLNVLIAGLWMIGCIPALATTVAYGALADRIGRRPVFALAMTGMVLAGIFTFTVMAFWRVLPIQLIWISPIFILIGGGEAVANMMFFAIANDVTTEANRATVFLLGGAGGLFAEIAAPSISSFLMLRSAWIPIGIGMGMLVVGTGLVILLPETLGMKPTNSPDDTSSSASDTSDAPKIDDTSLYSNARCRIINLFSRIYESTKIFHSLPILLLLCSFLVGPFGRVAGDMALRYISNRFHWQLREVGFLLSFQATINIILVVVILPLLSHYLLTRRSYSSKGKDLILAQGSVIALTIGALMLAIAPSIGMGIAGMVIWTLGTGFPAISRSLITTLVDQDHVGRLFAAIAVFELLCYMGAGPLQSYLYHLGLKWEGAWQGLPYYSLAVMYAIAGVAVFTFGWVMRKEMGEGAIRLGDNVERVEGENGDRLSRNVGTA